MAAGVIVTRATLADAGAIAAIYADHVRSGVATFEIPAR